MSKQSKTSGKISLADLSKFKPIDAAAFDQLDGESYGGGANYLQLEIGSVGGPFVFKEIRPQVKLSKEGEPVDIPVGTDANGKDIDLPVATIFRNQVEEAELNAGDVIYIRREPDAIKQKGKGKGNKMQVYSLKVVSRA
jgi:hypothetical protein